MKHENLNKQSPNIAFEPFANFQIRANLKEANFIIEPPIMTKSKKPAIAQEILKCFSPNYKTNITPQKKYKRKAAVWIPPGTSVKINGFVVEDGMLYVGDYFKTPNQYDDSDGALLNPHLPIADTPCKGQNPISNSLPVYKYIPPSARHTYLNWLTTGKNDPTLHSDYLFLYFYGLEYRLLNDINDDPSLAAERLAIETEIERLIDLYANHQFFHSRAIALLSYVRNDEYKKIPLYYTKPIPTPATIYHEGLSYELKLGIAQISRDKIPMPADWALSWYLSAMNPPFYVRTAATRCPAEFKQLFREEYTIAFDAGLIIKPNKSKITSIYYPVNRSLRFMHYEKNSDLPNIEKLRSPLKKLAPLIEVCHNQLDRYSRFIGRCPEKKANFDALLDLPISLWPITVSQILQRIKKDILSAATPHLLKFAAFTEELPVWENQTKPKMTLLLDLLETQYQLGFEPDCRYGGKAPQENTMIALFPLEKRMIAEDFLQPHYILATLIVKLSIFTVQADGSTPKKELALLIRQIDTWAWLSFPMQMRLKAQALSLSTQTVKMTGLKSQLQILTLPQRELLASVIVQIAQADGKVSVAEIKILEQIFKFLEMDSAILYNVMNQTSTPLNLSTLPPTFKSVMNEPQIENQIDMDKVALLQADSAKVTLLLDEIFAEAGTIANPPAPPKRINYLWKLSADLSDFALILSKKNKWYKTELMQLATKRGIMIEGALEQINDAAFDHCDEAFIEDDDAYIEINQDIVKVINQ